MSLYVSVFVEPPGCHHPEDPIDGCLFSDNVGVHWTLGGLNLHADTLAVSLFVIATIGCFPKSPTVAPVLTFLEELSMKQTLVKGWRAFVGVIFTFVLASNWFGALVPWSLIDLGGQGELSAPTNDINLTGSLALLVSHATFYTGLSEFGFGYFTKYVRPVSFLLPLNLLEEFSKPLSLSFRLLGNILADELTLAVLYSLVPFCIPVPVFLLGLFTSGIQALVFATLAGAYIGESLESLID